MFGGDGENTFVVSKFNFYMRCLLANAWPEPCFKYCSKVTAFSFVVKAQYHTSLYGRLLDEYCAEPSLCAFKRSLIFEVEPLYKLPSFLLLRIYT